MTASHDNTKATNVLLERIAQALERAAPSPPAPTDFNRADAFVWHPEPESFEPVMKVARVPLELLKGIDHVARQLMDNTKRFANGLPANNALLWGTRGMGKSSLIKAVHAEASVAPASPARQTKHARAHLILIEIHREDIATLPKCLTHLRQAKMHRFIVFCDDLSFDHDDTSYKSLKAVLEGGIEGRPGNVIFYATSNRRHLMPREMVENERSTAIYPAETVEEKVSLSDRFGLWLGFHNCTQDDYLDMVCAYAAHFGLKHDRAALEREALEWSMARGARSGRVAWQFIQDAAGRMGVALD